MKWLGYVLGGLMLLTGVVWLLQGLGFLPGSFMTGQPEWAVAGGLSIVVGGMVLWLAARKGSARDGSDGSEGDG